MSLTNDEIIDLPLEIDFYMVRHSESYNNKLLRIFPPSYLCLFKQDPRLSSNGLKSAKEKGIELKKYNVHFDAVFSSAMIRTMQTARELFYNSNILNETENIYIAPFVSEISMYCCCECCPLWENIPLEREDQLLYLLAKDKNNNNFHPNFDLVNGKNGYNRDIVPPSFDEFLIWLARCDEVKDLIFKPYLNNVEDKTKPFKLALVTHSRLLAKIILQLKNRPKNLDFLKIKLVYNKNEDKYELEGIPEKIINAQFDSVKAKRVSVKKIKRRESHYKNKEQRIKKKLSKKLTSDAIDA